MKEKKSTLVEDFLDYLENLPLMVETPWFHNSWKEYRTFLNKYGSHVITSVKSGSRFQQMVFEESSESYSERDFQVKACVSDAGPTSVGELGVSACSNVDINEMSKASKISVNETRFVRGVLRATNSELNNGKVSATLIKKLRKEADKEPSPIQHTFMPISSILQSRFKLGSKNYIRATNLDYYNGFLNYGCTYKKKSNLLNFKNSTKPEDQRRNVQNSNVQSQRKVAMATMIVTTCLVSGAIAEEKRAFATSRRNKSPLVPRKLHLCTRQNGTGKDAIGKSWGHGVAATTKISMKGTLCGPYLPPQKMSVNIKHLVTEPTTRQVILLQVKRKEWQHLTQLKMLPSSRRNIQFKPN